MKKLDDINFFDEIKTIKKDVAYVEEQLELFKDVEVDTNKSINQNSLSSK